MLFPKEFANRDAGIRLRKDGGGGADHMREEAALCVFVGICWVWENASVQC